MSAIFFELNGGSPSVFSAAPTSVATLILAQANRRMILFYNNGSATVYIGTSASVLTTTGFPVPPGGYLGPIYQSDPNTQQSANSAWYGITVSDTGDIRGFQSV